MREYVNVEVWKISFTAAGTRQHDTEMIIAICNQKGGTGKTTSAVLIAYALGVAGQSVGVIDRDPQQCAREWLEDAPGENVEIARPGKLYDHTIIDTPGSLADPGLIRGVREAERIIVTASGSPGEVNSTRRMAKFLKEKRPELNPVLLFSRIEANTEIGQGRDAFARTVGLPPLKNYIPKRQSIHRATWQGYPALPPGERENIASLAIEILNLKP